MSSVLAQNVCVPRCRMCNSTDVCVTVQAAPSSVSLGGLGPLYGLEGSAFKPQCPKLFLRACLSLLPELHHDLVFNDLHLKIFMISRLR